MEKIFINGLLIENAKQESDRVNIEGYACHFNKVNLNSEIVDESSFKTFFDMYNSKQISPKLNYNHNNDLIIGGIDEIISDKTGLYMTAHINKGVKICDEMLIPNILQGDLDSFSTEGYILNGYDGIIENEDNTYYVRDFILTAVGIVPTPADYDAKFSLSNYLKEYQLQQKPRSKWYLMSL